MWRWRLNPAGNVDARAVGYLLVVALLPGCGGLDALKARRIAREGNALYATAEFKKAIEKYHEAIALDPNTPNVYLNLGYSLFSIYRPESSDQVEKTAASEASLAFEKHLAQEPEDLKALTFRIKTLLRAAPSDPAMADKAFQLFTAMLDKQPNDHEARQYLISLFIDTKRYKQAVEYFSKDLQKKPDDLATMKILAIIADKSDEFDESIRWYQARAEKTPDPAERPAMYYELGTYLWNLLHYRPEKTGGFAGLRYADLGIEASKRAIKIKPDYAEAHVYANLLYLERAAREPTDFGKESCQRVAFEFRTKASAMMKKAKADALAGDAKTATKAEGGEK